MNIFILWLSIRLDYNEHNEYKILNNKIVESKSELLVLIITISIIIICTLEKYVLIT